jgi:hypothetical protein
MKPKHSPGDPMTLGNMRRLGVRNLIASCLNDACRHTALIDVSSYPVETEVPLRQVRRPRQQDRRAAELKRAATSRGGARLGSLAHVDLRCAVGIASEAHFVARQFG